MSANKIIQAFARKALTKNQGSGITTIPNQFTADAKAGEILTLLQRAGLPINQLDDYIRSEKDLLKFLNIIEATNKPTVYSGQAAMDQLNKLFPKKGEVLPFKQKRSFTEEIEAMKKSGDIVDEKDMVISDKITDREMFKDASKRFKKKEKPIDPDFYDGPFDNKAEELAEIKMSNEGFIADTVARITSMEPVAALKEANKIIKRQGIYKNLNETQSKKILKDTEDWIFQRDLSDRYDYTKNKPFRDDPNFDPDDPDYIQRMKDEDAPDDFAKGGRAGFQQGGLPAIDSRMNLDYNTLVEQNTDPMLQALKAQNKNSYIAPAPDGSLPPISELDKIREQVLKQQENNSVPTSQPGSLEEYLSGYEEYKAKNPNTYLGTQALINATLPGGIDYTFTGGSHASHFNDYLESIGLSPYQKNLNAISSKNLDSVKLNKGGIAGYYTGGMVDVEPNLSDIGHGSDALMARTRLVSPNSQATTSTGLNYLLAEDNDNIRVPFAAGGDAGRRAFLKLLASLTGGAAAVKSGIIGLGEGTTKKAITETVKKSAGSTYPPPYFYKLVEKIKFMGDDTLASKDKARAYKYKDYVMEEDFAGNIEIMKKQSLTDNPYPEDVYMSLKVDDVPIKGKKGSAKVEQYEEYTAKPDGDGKMKDVNDGVPDEVIEEAGDTTAMTLKKADGGRINFSAGSLARLGITGSSRRFLEKVFGKEKFARMIENDPELHRGMLEVVEMFRKKDKEGLKMYMQKFLPHMDDATVEDFIVGSGGTEGIEGQLIRLGSGRDYQGKIQMMKEADNMRKLDALDIDKMKPNANGGRITFDSGGSPLQRLRQEIVESMKPYAPGVPEEKLQIIVKDINFDMSPEEVQNTVRQGFINLFGMAKGGLATMLGE